ncbi:class I SAM-dependent methyltransferase [Actinomadura viridis]|uniref:SAM-dependent methyltransferase n=1 Tax=Actinomadura viridis TaxID=58110 RepID=A0A931DDI9_9ACTN|nr:class I SAM-dependent methyltransferase [Actinomadura viridis]MBG6086874.1 SAM-dependent methyltransferase [Actinomadura viridis]
MTPRDTTTVPPTSAFPDTAAALGAAPDTTAGEYVFDPVWDQETERLRTNEAIWDPGTFERFERLGVAPGWSCLEVGAGYGSAARRLAELAQPAFGVAPERLAGRRGPVGRVVAADLETERLGWLAGHGVEVWRHDLRADDLPEGAFDLIHARMVIQHLPDREAAVARLISALAPGGVLFLEDTDSLPLFRSVVSEDFLADIKASGYGLMRQAGHEPRGGHFDLAMLLESDLTDVSAEGRVVMMQGGSDQARHYMLWLEYMRPKIVEAGLLGHDRIDQALAEMADPAHRWLSQVMISVVGRRPR